MKITDNHKSVTQAADELGVSERTIFRWIESGKIKCKKVATSGLGYRIEIAESEIERIKKDRLNLATVKRKRKQTLCKYSIEAK